jgi:hypothetical protein
MDDPFNQKVDRPCLLQTGQPLVGLNPCLPVHLVQNYCSAQFKKVRFRIWNIALR